MDKLLELELTVNGMKKEIEKINKIDVTKLNTP